MATILNINICTVLLHEDLKKSVKQKEDKKIIYSNHTNETNVTHTHIPSLNK